MHPCRSVPRPPDRTQDRCMRATAHKQAHSVYEPKTEAYEYWLSLDIMATGLSSRSDARARTQRRTLCQSTLVLDDSRHCARRKQACAHACACTYHIHLSIRMHSRVRIHIHSNLILGALGALTDWPLSDYGECTLS